MPKLVSMKIATWNINGVKARIDNLQHWLKASAPDIVCLQEIKSVDDQFPRLEIEALGYHVETHGQKGFNGVALLSRTSPDEINIGLPGDESDEQARFIEGVFSTDKGALRVASIYLPNGNPAPGPKFDYKLRWFKRLHAYATELIDLDIPALLIGDYNVMPTDLDVYAPERWRDDALFRPEVRKAYADLVAQGWTDAIRHLHPDERLYTFWKYWRNSLERDAGLRIDHFLLSPSAAPWLRSASVRRAPRSWEHTSDHAPVMIEIDPPTDAD